MTEIRSEIGNDQHFNPDLVIQSIEQTEKWWSSLKQILESDREGVVSFIEDALKLYQELEEAALNPEAHFPKTAQEASKIKALWVISAPGTYFKAEKNDRYRGKKWALWNDRQRVNYALQLGRRLAGEDLPLIVYSGRPDEDAAVLEAAATPWLRFPQGNVYPKEKIFVINPIPPIDNLLDQIRTFRLPPGLQINSGYEIGVVIHAPQAIRLLYNLNNSRGGIPKEATLRIFPLPTPVTGMPEYPLQEVRGLINSKFIANPPIAADTPYPCKY